MACVTIRIGGTLPSRRLPTLTVLIEQAKLSIDWDATPFDLAKLRSCRPLDLVANAVAWTELGNLENFCVAENLSFARWSGDYSDGTTPSRVVFSGTGHPRTFHATSNDEILIDLATLRRLGSMQAIEAHFAAANFVIPPFALCRESRRSANA